MTFTMPPLILSFIAPYFFNVAKGLQQQLTKLIDDNPEANVFCDEALIGGLSGVPEEFLVELSKKVREDSFFWLACNFESKPSKTLLKSGDNYRTTFRQTVHQWPSSMLLFVDA